MTDRELMDRARAMLDLAWAPYSKFPVGAALLCRDGSVFTGCNVENGAYGSTLCAERVALVKAVSEGHRDDLACLAVVSRGAQPCWPCGACRQMLSEFAPTLRILVGGEDGGYIETTLDALLPHSFSL